ncbi:radical SAM protein [Desulfitobacterium chlororespirans]|uniref:Radical SAM additional 4Fe4S-binding SPASM domain-containing protein n=1 Tax=Desulfitobacterium chlororespirans DSM 11544 TaxID=1121395 RepID=A0A1M7UKI3_9FIRM|nr:radical SAM protein [Desulfitobacterium chlororespirans]SHN83489.1 radical SAM additional 4Fe4S-binding SPASM domain-containing protein [Desulfitobacterium chlororespirans DSM 11544]
MTFEFPTETAGIYGSFAPGTKTLKLPSQTMTFHPSWEDETGRLYIIFSTECNLRCVYCFQNGMRRSNGDLDIGQLHTYIGELQNEIQEIVLFGGEPLLHSNLEIIASVLERFDYLRFIIFTNGNFDREYLDLIDRYSYTIAGITISLDGPREIHNRRRINPRRDSYAAIMENLLALAKLGVNTTVSINVDRSNAGAIHRLFDDILKFASLHTMNYMLNPVKYIQNALTYQDLFDLYFSLKSRYPLKIFLNNRLIDNLSSLFANKPLSRARCNLAKTLVLNIPEGSIFACPQNAATKIGSMTPQGITVDKTPIDHYLSLTRYSNAKCGACDLNYLCPFGCPFIETESDCRNVVELLLQKALDHFELLVDVKELGM